MISIRHSGGPPFHNPNPNPTLTLTLGEPLEWRTAGMAGGPPGMTGRYLAYTRLK